MSFSLPLKNTVHFCRIRLEDKWRAAASTDATSLFQNFAKNKFRWT